MDYEQKYKEALERAKECLKDDSIIAKAYVESIFPEIKEIEDERIRKALKQGFFEYGNSFTTFGGIKVGDIITWLEKQDVNKEYVFRPVAGTTIEKAVEQALGQGNVVLAFNGFYTPVKGKTSEEILTEYDNWLEKQGEQTHVELSQSEVTKISDQELSDKSEPKFKVGDWITDGYIHCKIAEILDDRYVIESKFCKRSAILFEHANRYHLWTIQDAKDGDVLATDNGNCPFIYRTKTIFENPVAYCGVRSDGLFISESPENHQWCLKSEVIPATKEQRDLLFQKMKEAGYEWDAEKKELKKIDAYQLSENPCSNCTNTKGCITCVNGDHKSTSTPRILYSDEVIEWLNHRELSCDDVVTTVIPDDSPTSVRHKVRWLSDEFIKKFKKDFGL